MSSRRIHKSIGLIMLLPIIGWTVTGLVFFIKPGYEGAYEILKLKTYSLDPGYVVSVDERWQEVRIVKSILGTHLLVKSNGVTQNLDPSTYQPAQVPEISDLIRLFDDTISHNKERYGTVDVIENTRATTTTGIEIDLDWNALSFSQSGFDKAVINTLYKIHYLQWTPWPIANQILGVVGLLLLVILTLLGVRIYFASGRQQIR